jgi:hypothetical protein
MSTTNFVDRVTPINATWLNDVDAATYEGAAVYTPAGTGATTRTVQAKLRESVSVLDFGADPTGVADSTAAIQAAIDAQGTTASIYFPTGTYLVSSAITLNKPGVYFGDGWATNIRTSSATANIFTCTGAEQIHIEKMQFTSSATRSAGWYVDVAASANRFRLSDFAMDGAIGGVRTAAVATVTIESGQILNSVASTGVGIRVNAGFDVSIRDVIMDQASQLFAGIYVVQTGDLTIEDCNIIRSGSALLIQADAGDTIASVWCNNSYFDTSTKGIVMFANGASASIVRCIFDQCWFSGHTDTGAELQTTGGGVINGVEFNGCHGFLNGDDAITLLDTGVTNVSVNGGAYAQNAGGAVSVGAGVSSWNVRNARMGSSHGLTGNTYGVFIAAGASADFSITNNDLRGNVTASINDGSSGTGRLITDNIGFGTGSAVYDPANLVDGAGVTTTVTVTGATLGDIAEASFSLDLVGITLTAWVSAANTVSVRFQNETGIAVDLGSGTLRARIKRST